MIALHGGKGEDRGWDGWMATPTRWSWVWVTLGDSEGQRPSSVWDTATELMLPVEQLFSTHSRKIPQNNLLIKLIRDVPLTLFEPECLIQQPWSHPKQKELYDEYFHLKTELIWQTVSKNYENSEQSQPSVFEQKLHQLEMGFLENTWCCAFSLARFS